MTPAEQAQVRAEGAIVNYETEHSTVDAKTMSREKFDALPDGQKAEVVRQGYKLYDEMAARHFNRMGSVDRAEFRRLGGRVVDDGGNEINV
jgi:hypothetical protein